MVDESAGALGIGAHDAAHRSEAIEKQVRGQAGPQVAQFDFRLPRLAPRPFEGEAFGKVENDAVRRTGSAGRESL